MVEVEEIDIRTPAARRKRLEWLLTVFLRPGRAMHEIAQEDKPVWLVPMLLLTVLALVSVLVAGPLRLQAAQNATGEPPPNFQYMSPEQQQQYMQAQESMNSPAMIYLFPSIGKIIGVWLGWFLLGGILHLVLTLLGSRSTNTVIYNLAAWASLPILIRFIVQIVAMLSTRQLITSPGVSGFLTADGQGVMLFARIILSLVDLYLIWQLVLLWVGAVSTSGLPRGKALGGVLISFLLLLVLSALPGFLSAQLSGLNVTRPFMFF